MKRFEIFFGLIKIPTDLLMTVLAFISAYRLRLITSPIEGIAKPIDFSTLPTLNEYIYFGIVTSLALVIIFAVGKMYSLKTTVNFSKEIGRAVLLVFIWVMAIITYFFFTRTFPFSRLAIFYSWTFTLVFIVFGRSIIKFFQLIFLKNGFGKRNLLFIGQNDVSGEIVEELSKKPGYRIVEILSKNHLGQLEYLSKKHKVDEIIQTESIQESNENILEFCDLNHITYRFIPDLLDVRRTNIEVETVGSIPIITLKTTPLDGWGKVLKRVLDVFGATFGMIIFSPIFLITAIAIKLDSKGPILFTKLDDGSPVKRVGQKGKLFKFYKFRSMREKTDSLREKLSDKNLRTDGPLMKIENDPRVTGVGKFIRKYSIDELPQLFSVLVGDLSLVGPRPHLPEEVAKYQKHHRFVFTIKPGITGLAQISGRSDLSFEEEVRLDRYYIENWSLLLDLKIIFKTLFVVMKGYRE